MVVVVPSRVFPIPGFNGPIPNHHGKADAIGGSDIFAPRGSKVVSMVEGTVTFISTQATASTSGGNAVQIKGKDGLMYYYAHLENVPLVKQGQEVKAGQLLGTVGDTGNAKGTGAHLHIGIGKSIQTGLGPQGGIGSGFNAVDMLRALQKQLPMNDPKIVDPKVQTDLQLNFVPAVPGFSVANASGILLIVQKALKAGLDPFLVLGIVAHESGFDPNATNPKSGACGYMQIYPCIKLEPDKNIDEGLKRLKYFLDNCSGDWNCALNKYSGGGGQTYIDIVKKFGGMIKGANPGLATTDPDTISVGTDVDSDSGDVSAVPDECPPIKVPVGLGIEVPFPDVGCLLMKTVNDLQDQMANWWTVWQTQNFTNIVFIIGGILFLALGIVGIVQEQGGFSPTGIAMKQVSKRFAASD